MIDMAFLLSALAFIGTLILLAAGYYYMKYRRDRIDIVEKVRSGGRPARPEETEPSPETGSAVKNAFLKMSARAGGFGKPKANDIDASNQRKLFQNAGIRHPAATAVFWGAKVMCAAALPAVALFAQLFAEQSLLRFHVLPTLAVLALLGFFIPDFYLKLMIRRRKQQIIEGFPDALDLLVVCVEAGMGLDAAIYRVAEEIQLSSRVISEEFRILNLELRAGKARLDALRNLGVRTDVEDVRSFTTLLIQTDRFGTSVAQALRVHSDAMRTKRYQKAEEVAMKLPVKLIFPLLLFIFPAMFVVIAGPAVIQIYRTLIAQ